MWEWTPEVNWTPNATNGRLVSQMTEGSLTRFIQQKQGTTVNLEKTDRVTGEYIGMMKFPLIYRNIDPVTGNE